MSNYTGNPVTIGAGTKITATKLADWEAALDALTDVWTTYATSFTGSTTNPVLGTGGSITARYKQTGKTIHYVGKILFGTSGITIGSGTYIIDLPVAALNLNLVLGSAFLNDSGTTTNRRAAVCRGLTTTSMNFYAGTGNVVTSSTIFTFDVSDSIEWNVVYEAA